MARQAAPAAFSPPAPAAFLGVAFQSPEADAPSFHGKEAAEGASHRQEVKEQQVGKDKRQKEKAGQWKIQTTFTSDKCFVFSVSDGIVNPPDTDSSKHSFLVLRWESTGSAPGRGFSLGFILLEAFCCKPERK